MSGVSSFYALGFGAVPSWPPEEFSPSIEIDWRSL
jgi:hypothetical protein